MFGGISIEVKLVDFLPGEAKWVMPPLPSGLTTLKLCPIFDVHEDDRLFWEKGFDKYLKWILGDPEAYAVLGGDLVNMASRGGVSDIYSSRMTPDEQIERMESKLAPLAKANKILGAVSGNHEGRAWKDSGHDMTRALMKALGLEHAYRYSGLILVLRFGQGFEGHSSAPYTYTVYITHGFGGARTKGAKLAKVERMSTFVDADCHIMGHDHESMAAPKVVLSVDTRGKAIGNTGWQEGRTSGKRVMLVKANAWLKWGGYAESGGFGPSDLVPPIILFKGNIDGMPFWHKRAYQKEIRTLV